MIDLDSTFFIQLVNFLVIWMVLNIILFKPIRGIIKKRKDLMADQMSAIEKFTSEASTKLKDYESALDAARKVGAEERNKLKEEGSAKELEMVNEAAKVAAEEIGRAKDAIHAESKQAMDSLKSDVDAMAQKATSKILA